MTTHTTSRRDPSTWAAARAVGGVTQQLLLSQLSAANSTRQVECCLSAALHVFISSSISPSCSSPCTKQEGEAVGGHNNNDNDDDADHNDNNPLVQQCLQQLEPHAAVVGWRMLRMLFLQDQFEAWASGVLAVAAGEWLPQLQGGDPSRRRRLWGLISDTFNLCPAWHALAALSGHLSAVTPQSSFGRSTGSTTVTALAADSAAELLLQRFLAPDNCGLQELLTACDAASSSTTTPAAAAAPPPGLTSSSPTASQQQQQQHHQEQQSLQEQYNHHPQQQQQQQEDADDYKGVMMSDEGMQEAAAALLAALPDRLLHLLLQEGAAAAGVPPQLQQSPAAIVTTLVEQCISFVASALSHAAGVVASAAAAAAGNPPPSSSSSSSTSAAAGGSSRCSQGPGSSDGSQLLCAVGGGHSSSSMMMMMWQPHVAPGAVQLTASLLQRLITRGHGSTVAAVILKLAVHGSAAANGSTSNGDAGGPQQQQHQSSACSGLRASTGRLVIPAMQQVLLVMMQQQQQHSAAAAMEKLLVRLLRTACTSTSLPPLPPTAAGAGAQGAAPQQLQQQQQQQCCALEASICPLLQYSAPLRRITLQKLLLNRTLPASSLSLLLRLLAACQPSLLPEASAVLAEAWCDSSTVLHVPVAQQAYMTAALVSCIQQLPRELLDPASSHTYAAAESAASKTAGASVAGSQVTAAEVQQQQLNLSPYLGVQPEQVSVLLPSIIQGVSTRLASPSPAIRLQSMRVGRAFAEKLDPSKPMFEDAGALDLMPEELWPGVAEPQAHSPHDQQQQQEVQQDTQHMLGSQLQQDQSQQAADVGSGSSSSTFRALARLAEATAGPDSDDEDATLGGAAQNSSSSTPASGAGAGDGAAAAGAAAAHADTSWEAGSVSGGSEHSEGADSLLAFDLQEDLSAEQWWGPDGLGPTDSKALGLRAIAAALRKQDDVAGALEALKKVEVLVRAEPDELPVVAPELARALVHCKVPLWADSPASAAAAATPSQQHNTASELPTTPQQPSPVPRGISSNADVQRQQALIAVLSVSPLTTGDTLIAELYSPNLDQHQRMLVLDGLASAALEMSDPRKAPQLALQGPQRTPELLPPAAAAAPRRSSRALPSSQKQQQEAIEGSKQQQPGTNGRGGVKLSSSPSSSSGGDQPGAADSSRQSAAAAGLVEASSRVWGKVSLQKQAQAAASANGGGRRTFRNRFAPVAVRWATALLQQCDVRQQGIDLFGRDSLLLGRLLTVLGSFVEAAAETPAAVPLCAALLELLKAPEVSAHKEAFVRRSALVAASQVVRHLPPARLAGAMIGRQADPQDQLLVERLQWLMSWAQQAAVSDVDQHCKLLAAGCVAWHVELAEGAMAALEHLPEPEGPSLAAVAANKRGAAGKQKDIQVQLPSVERLVLS